MKIKAHAKINLTLNIIGKRPDGYHDVDMIMQTIGLCDIIEVEKRMNSIEITGTGHIPYDKTNLAYRAAKLFFDVTGIRSGAKIHIWKNIPVCAGMAGGSADAAAVFRALNLLHGKPLSQRVLSRISSKLGADVPYCIRGGTARAEGIGDIITVLSPLKQSTVVVVKPPVSVSTPIAYSSLDYPSLEHPDTEEAAKAIENGDNRKLYSLIGNSFEKSIFSMFPELGEIKSRLLSLGASASAMSGSGSAVFGIFDDDQKAKEAYEYFHKTYKNTYLTHTV